MKLMSPVNSYESALAQIEAGADEIYLGLDYDTLSRISFSGRARVLHNGKSANVKDKEFRRIVELAHEHGVTVHYTANSQFMFKSNDNWFQKLFYDYVVKGIDMGVDTLIVSDIANIIFLNKMGIKTPIVAGSFLCIFNSDAIQIFKDLNVKRVILPDQVLLDEMKIIKEKVGLEIEIFVSFGCSNVGGNCGFAHNQGEDVYLGVPCRSTYFVNNSNESICFLDSSLDCAICSLPELYEAGVDSIKIIGREQDYRMIASITQMYKHSIEETKKNGHLSDDFINKVVSTIPWWKDNMCKSDRCRFLNNKILHSYI